MLCLLKTSRDLQMLFAAVAHLVEGLNHETLLTLKLQSDGDEGDSEEEEEDDDYNDNYNYDDDDNNNKLTGGCGVVVHTLLARKVPC
jgi:hypothetical protein